MKSPLRLVTPFLLVLAIFWTLSGPSFGQISSDGRQLPRDYDPGVITPAIPSIVGSDEQEWETVDAHTQRKVFHSDRITFVILKVQGSEDPGGPIKLHYHKHDQISHVLEGEVLVNVNGSQKKIGPGGTYVVPSNIHHGIRVLTENLVLMDMFTPTRDDFRPKGSQTSTDRSALEVDKFVRDWFALFDRNAPVKEYLSRLVDQGLHMQFPEVTLSSHRDFRRWYQGILETVTGASHTLKTVNVTRAGEDKYQVDLVVLWEATVSGKKTSFLAHQLWEVLGEGKSLRIQRYIVEAAGNR